MSTGPHSQTDSERVSLVIKKQNQDKLEFVVSIKEMKEQKKTHKNQGESLLSVKKELVALIENNPTEPPIETL